MTGRLCFDTCLSVCPHLEGYPGQVQARGVPQPCAAGEGGVHLPGGFPTSGIPPSDLAGGVPRWQDPTLGTPPSDLARGVDRGIPQVPPVRPGWGYPDGGYPSGTPHQTWPGGTPTMEGRTPPRVVLHTPQSVCLLRSRRRTF